VGRIFQNDLHDEFGCWPLGYIPYGGADYGEVLAVARAVGDGDDGAYYEAFMAAGDRLCSAASDTLGRGHRASARESYLRASCLYGTAYHPLYGRPVDPRLLAAFRMQMAAFDSALAIGEPRIEPMRIPFGGAAMPAYFIPADGRAGETRPLLILTNGYDAVLTDMYFASAVAATRRGYHCLLFDGPGQGEMLIEQGITMRPDWETVVAAVMDVAVTLPGVDPQKIALSGWSLGGYLALRAASGEKRLAACVADPGFMGMAVGIPAILEKLGASKAHGLLDASVDLLGLDRKLKWVIVQRGFWVLGVDTFSAFVAAAETYTLDGRLGDISCPTLLTAAENDPLGRGAEAVYEALTCPKTLLRFTAAEGAGEHCEMMNRSLVNRRVLDWLDDRLGA
jgi:alpha-beta hydrolase superfamily lysophospholipase